jgi:hypothetical protein
MSTHTRVDCDRCGGSAIEYGTNRTRIVVQTVDTTNDNLIRTRIYDLCRACWKHVHDVAEMKW